MIAALLAFLPALGRILASFFGMRTEQAKAASQEDINRTNAQASVQQAEGHFPINAIVRALYAVPPALYFGKLYIWDKMLGWGTTDPLSPDMRYVAMTVIAFYFLTTARA